MNVDIANFSSVVPSCLEEISGCDFLSIDLEMTGLSDEKGRLGGSIDFVDSQQTVYEKMKKIAETFGIIQVGICVATRDSEKKQLCLRPYNFYVFPRPVGNKNHRQFSLCADGINFNRQHQMDFGRWMNKGIGFVDEEQEREMVKQAEEVIRGRIKANQKSTATTTVKSTGNSEEDVFVEDQLKAVRQWAKRKMDDGKGEAKDGSRDEKEDEQMEGESCCLPLAVCSNQRAELLKQKIWSEYPSTFVEEEVIGRGWKRKLSVLMLKEEEVEERKMKFRKKEEEKLVENIGFRRVWKHIVDSRKPIVLHNGLFDVLFLLSHFQQRRLPETLLGLKQLVHSTMPTIFDTKTLSTFLPSKFPDGTSLEGLASQVEDKTTMSLVVPSPFPDFLVKTTNDQPKGQVKEDDNIKSNISSSPAPIVSASISPPPPAPVNSTCSFHDAAYDAFQTARVFALLKEDEEVRENLLPKVRNRMVASKAVKTINFNINPEKFSVENNLWEDFEQDAELCGDDGFMFWIGEFPKAFTNTEFDSLLLAPSRSSNVGSSNVGSSNGSIGDGGCVEESALRECVELYGRVGIRWINDTNILVVGFKGGDKYRTILKEHLEKKKEEGIWTWGTVDEAQKAMAKT
eukprot:GHVS01094236.1.p1 GENE.GHVS01094236.1~~GHVS01094236.1.p1  ORF type:complete len:627 (+),score=142.85 GHVS01094236.1:50-1930(+)